MSFVSHLTHQLRDDWPAPKIGYYYAVCCLLDLYRTGPSYSYFGGGILKDLLDEIADLYREK